MLQAGRLQVQFLSTKNLPVGKGQPVHKADNLTAISEPIV
jgi:hypothetical protein